MRMLKNKIGTINVIIITCEWVGPTFLSVDPSTYGFDEELFINQCIK